MTCRSTQKFIGIAVAFLITGAVFTFSGCGKDEEKKPSIGSEQTQNGNGADTRSGNNSTDGIELKETYNGKNITLTFPSSENSGQIDVIGEDAKAIFDALAVTPILLHENPNELPTRVRQGYKIVCKESAKKETPDRPVYKCSLNINYKAGTVSWQTQQINEDKSVALPQGYIGTLIHLIAPDHPRFFSVLSISGKDAQVLYNALNVQPIRGNYGKSDWNPAKIKQTQEMTCFEMEKRQHPPQPKEYACNIYFNYRNGMIIRPGNE